MIARTLAIGLVLLVAALIESAVLPFLPISGLQPDLLLLIVLAIALHDGAQPALRVGFAAGFLADLLVAQSPVGSAMLVYTMLGGIVGTARPYLAPRSFTAPLILAFVTGVVGTAAYGMLSLLLGEDRITWEALLAASLRVGLFNTLLAPFFLAFLDRLTTRFPTGTAPGNE